jgi:tripeptide aminopeptidase
VSAGFFYSNFYFASQNRHPYEVSGGVAQVKMGLLLRDHHTPNLEIQAEMLRAIARQLETEYPKAKIEVSVRKQYRNMADALAKDPRPMKLAEDAMKRAGLVPTFPILRGGTDGSRLTELGLPTPNLSTGEHNLHSPLEFTCLEEMATAVKVVVELAIIWGEENSD